MTLADELGLTDEEILLVATDESAPAIKVKAAYNKLMGNRSNEHKAAVFVALLEWRSNRRKDSANAA